VQPRVKEYSRVRTPRRRREGLGQLATVALKPFARGQEGRRPLQVNDPTHESGETVELLEETGEH
jgi:hypothetical protein